MPYSASAFLNSPSNSQQIILVHTRRPSYVGSRVLRVLAVTALVQEDLVHVVGLGSVSSSIPTKRPPRAAMVETYTGVQEVVAFATELERRHCAVCFAIDLMGS